MSLQGSQLKYSTVSRRTGSKQDLASGGYTLSRSEGGQFLMSGNGYQSDFNDGFIQQGYTTFSKTSAGGYGHQTSSPSSASQSKAQILYNRCMHKLETAQRIMETGGSQAEFDNAMAMAMDDMKQLRMCAMELKTYGQPYEAVSKSLEECSMLQSSLMSRGGMTLGGGAMTLGGGGMTLGGGGMTLGGGGMTLGGGGMTLGGGGIRRKFSTGRDDLGRSFNDAIAWIHQKKRLIETAPFGDKADAIEEQITSHNRFHSSIQKGLEVEKARDELMQKGEKSLLHILDQEWDSLQKMSHARSSQLRELHNIIMEISEAIMWVNIREEEELVFDWGDKQIDTYIPKKQESYSRLMKELESKEKDLNKVKGKVDQLLKNQHPASDKIEAYMDTLQTQWSWLLQITKCINVHLKENAAYSQFFKEANEIYCKLENANSVIRNKFKCDKNTSLEQLNVLLKELEKEKERVAENKRLVHTLVNKSKSIIRLKPRNPEEKSNSPVIVKALCDFKQDQKGIFKDDEGILKDNSQRSKWNVTGPGGLDMLVPSVCLIIPPPNPLSISLAQKNEAFYDSIISIWDHLYITLKSLISWQYCVRDIDYIKSLTFNMLSKMKPEEYRRIITNLELHFQDFLKFSKDSKMFGPEDTFSLESEYKNAQAHYVTLLTTAKQPANVWTEQTKPVLAPPTPAQASLSTSTLNLKLLTQINTLRRRLEAAEAGLGQHLHVPYNENCVQDCTQRLHLIQGVHHDLESIRDEYLHLRDTVMRQLEGTMDKEQASFLRSELDLINQRLGSLQTFSTAYLQRLTALRGVLEGLLCTNDIVKVHEVKLTEKDTSFLDLAKLQDYCISLRQMKADLEQKKELLTSMEVALTQAMYWNGQIDQSFHQCDGDLSKYKELVGQMSDRWRRILTQIDSRLWDLEKQEKQVKHYQQSSSQLSQWMDNTSQRLDGMQASKFSSMNALLEHLNQQKALHSEIKGKKEKVDDVQNDANMCATSIKDYEMQLASYGAGLETLLNIPIKRTVLQSPATVLSQEAGDLQSRYIELLTRSSDYYKFLAEMRKSMEELKIQNTKIELLEEELRHLKEELQNSSQRNKSLEDIIADFKLRLSKTKEEEYMIRRETNAALQSQQSIQITLESTQSKVKELTDRVAELMLLIEDEKRKRRLAEERYNSQQEEYETVIRKRQKELDQVNWSKIDIEKAVKDKEREIERLKTQLEDEATRRRTAESEVSKVRTECSQEISQIKQTYESQIHVQKTTLLHTTKQKEEDTSALKLQLDKISNEKKDLEEELRRLQVSISHKEEARKKAEGEVRQLSASGTEDSRRRQELEVQINFLKKQNTELEIRFKEELSQAKKGIEEKAHQITTLTHSLEDERRRRKASEMENQSLRQGEAELRAKHTSSLEAVSKLKTSEEELKFVSLELEKQTNEKYKTEQNVVRLQSRISDLNAMLSKLEAELEREKRSREDEVTKRQRMEAELERVNRTCQEYTTTISTLNTQKMDETTTIRKYEQDLRRVQDELDRSLREHKATSEQLTKLRAELKALQQQLLQEQGRVREANLRNETLYKTIEEKSRALNESITEIEKLKSLTQSLTKEHLKLEEELRSMRQERDDIRAAQNSFNSDHAAKLSALELQLQTTNKRNQDLQTQINDLRKERDNLQVEITKTKKQYTEISMTVRSSETRTIELQNERDSLLAKLRLMEADKGKLQRYEDELSRLKITLESELRQKQQFQDELAKIRKDLNHWKSQYEIRETDKNKAEKDKASSLIEIQRLTTELRSVEDRYKTRLQKLELEVSDLMRRKESVEKELWKLKQRPNTFPKQTQTDENMSTVDPSKLLFDGIRRKVTAHQLLECGIIEKVTLDKLLRGQKTVEEVAVSIQPSLKGTGVIAGVVQGSQKRLSIAEAKHQKLLSPECAIMLLEAQAATGHIIDPKFNEKMSLDTACSRNVVGTEDRDTLIRAEAACTGFKDPYTGKLMSAGQACKKGHLDRETTLRLLQAQEAAGGIIDPVLSVFLPKNVALDRSLIDDELYRALNKNPTCYVEPETGKVVSYSELRKKSIMEPTMGLLLLPVKDETSIKPCCDYNCVAGIYDEAHQRVLPFYKAKQDGLLRPGTTLELLEAQAATGFMIDPINNVGMNVEEAWKRGLIGKEFKEKLHSAEKAVTGYKDPRTGEIISLFQAIERGIIERGHGIRLLEAQIASGGIIDPKTGRRINVDEAYAKGYFDRTMNQILKYEGDDTKGFFDPNNEENLTYLQLTKRCIRDPKTGLLLLPLMDKKKQADLSSQKNTLRKRRVVIVDPETGKEMSVREAYHRELIDYDTFLELSEQECEWEEITITNSDGSSRLVIVDRKTGKQYDIQDSLNKGIISRSTLDQYRAGTLTLTQLANLISSKTSTSELAISTSIPDNLATCSSPTEVAPSSPTVRKRFASVSITLSPPSDVLDDQSPIAAIFDSETLEKITVSEALRRGIVDTITAQRLLEAQVCTGGVINPATGQRLFLQDAVHQGIIDDDMASKLKPAQKAYTGFEDVKTQGKMSAAEAMKEKWLPYEAGQRFLEFQYLTGGLMEPGSGTRVSIEEAIRRGWLDGKGAQKLQDTKSYMKILTCPKTKLKVSYKEALDNCMVEETKAIKMLQASSMSTKGISSPYNISPGPGSRTGSRSGSRSGSRRGSVDYTSFSFSRISPSF
ncbi:desmoplakin isoform X1 [Electrophorus electricus]|uniref:desmoplakin isoform X1 n=1 Tax=Electrophorus electricus TaxID=8005 RepID=UPI0015D0ABDA|nr:desmoplakin isoform X1 [Electrophorus electricus]